MRILVLLLPAVMAFCADLPVKQVVLYKHGVGFFERSGRLAAGDVDDAVDDEGGGRRGLR